MGKKYYIFLLIIFHFLANGQITKKVLFLGNSYTSFNNLTNMVSQLAINSGDILIFDSYTPGGYTLNDHFASQISKNKIMLGGWDYIVLQEQSQLPSFEVPSSFFDGFSSLSTFIKINDPCSIIMSYMTWGHLNGDSTNCANFSQVCSFEGMNTLIKDRYINVSNLNESEITPVGSVWKYIKDNNPTISLYQNDGSHPTVEGTYLAACCFYTSIFKKNPVLLNENLSIDPIKAATIRNVVKTIIYDQFDTWFIGKYIPEAHFSFKIDSNNTIIVNTNTSKYYDSFNWDFGDGSFSTSLFPSHTYQNDGAYTIKLTASNCYLGESHQSILEKNVTFCSHTNSIFPNLFLCPNETALVWTQIADSYQWCDMFGAPINGAINQSFVVTAGNEYSVITTINGCSERSIQFFVDGPFNIEDCNLKNEDFTNSKKLKIYPNPTNGDIFIQPINIDITIQKILILDSNGKLLLDQENNATNLNISHLNSGIYIIKIVHNKGTDVEKIVKF